MTSKLFQQHKQGVSWQIAIQGSTNAVSALQPLKLSSATAGPLFRYVGDRGNKQKCEFHQDFIQSAYWCLGCDGLPVLHGRTVCLYTLGAWDYPRALNFCHSLNLRIYWSLKDILILTGKHFMNAVRAYPLVHWTDYKVGIKKGHFQGEFSKIDGK